MKFQINGIQQLGVGVPDINEAWKWYNNNFGVDVKVVDETAVAQFMLPHTGGKPRERRAIIAISMQGGGGLEIWQHTGKTPEMPKFQIQLGDLGISVGKMKTLDAQKAYDTFKAKGLNLLTEVVSNPMGTKHFYLMDPYQNIWEFVEDSFVFDASKGVNGGAFGAVIGVVDVEKSLEVYRDILGYDVVVYDKEGVFEDFNGVPGGGDKFRRVLLAMSNPAQGAFSPLFGPSQIELVQVSGREPKTIFEGRLWGDPGFIQVCYDIVNMDDFREFVASKGYPFTVDSARAAGDFDMGETTGNFSYIQAPESTLLEFVETLRVPLVKKLGLALDFKKRDPYKPLPRWMLKLLALKREKL